MKRARSGLSVPLVLCLALIGIMPSLAPAQRLSPTDSTVARFDGRQIKVIYGAPAARGRVIYGGLVPFDRVWRTGANEATLLTTEANLRIGDAEVPAGTYSLYTIPGDREWALIINRQTGQWGTEYHADMDLARVRMEVDDLGDPVEVFRIAVEGRGANRGMLVIEWANTRASVPFEILR